MASWVLDLDPPGCAARVRARGRATPTAASERVCDPGNPHRAPGAFGEKSVLLLPGYEPPAWLERRGVEGATTRARRCAAAGSAPRSPSASGARDAADRRPLPLLVAHDGPEYDALARLTHFGAAMIARGRAAAPPRRAARPRRPQRVVLGLGALRRRAGPRRAAGDRRDGRRRGPVAGMGASLGGAGDAARAAPPPAHVRRACSCSRAASSCRASTPTSARFPRYRRIVRFVARDAARAAARRHARARRADLRHRRGEHRTTTG